MLKKILFLLAICAVAAAPAFAQSTAANGAIEGTVTDNSGGVLPGVTMTITNTGTGAERVVTTNERGLYRAPLLPLGGSSGDRSGFADFARRVTVAVALAATSPSAAPPPLSRAFGGAGFPGRLVLAVFGGFITFEIVAVRRVVQRRDVLLGDDEHVGRRDRVDVAERERVIVFEDDLRRDLFSGDLAEEAQISKR